MKSRTEPEGFAEFWSVWRPFQRKTDGRGLARDCFAKHIKAGADPQDIIDGAKCFFRTMKDRDRDYVPLSATWLNRGAYEDLAIDERAHQQRMEQHRARRIEEMRVASVPQLASSSVDPDRRAEIAAKARAVMRGHA